MRRRCIVGYNIDMVDSIINILNTLAENISWFDILLVFFIGYFLYNSNDFISSFADLLGFMVTLLLSYRLYLPVAKFFVAYLSFPRGISQAVSFFLVWFIIESVLFIVSRIALNQVPLHIQNHRLNRYLAFVPAFIQACIFFFLITITIFSLPVKASIKEEILRSKTGPYLISFSHILESRIKNVFGEAVNETLNFLTIREGGAGSIDLGFTAAAELLSVDSQSEDIMIALVNRERNGEGISTLTENIVLRDVARLYGKEMMSRGFFSHESQVDGSSPAQRVERNGITYLVTGENLAYAPDVYLAHQGLMNSPGHRKNILSEEYGEIGVGVVDGGIYGKMFVQIFKD